MIGLHTYRFEDFYVRQTTEQEKELPEKWTVSSNVSSGCDSTPMSCALTVLNDKSAFKHQRTILFDALMAWASTACSTQIRSAISSRILDIFKRYEEKVLKSSNSECILKADAAVRRRLGDRFFREVYYPIGGTHALHKGSRTTSLRSLLSEAQSKKEILSILKLIEITHFHAVNLTDTERYRKPSLNVSHEALSDIADNPNSWTLDQGSKKPRAAYYKKTEMESIMAERGISAVYLYCSQFVALNENTSLFDYMFARKLKLSLIRKKDALSEWLSYVSFFKNHVLTQMNSTAFGDLKRMQSLRVEPKEIPVPSLDEWEIAILTEKAKKDI